MNTWTPEMAKTSIVLAVLLMAIAVYVFRKDKAMMLVMCFMIFAFFIYQPVMKMEKQECTQDQATAYTQRPCHA